MSQSPSGYLVFDVESVGLHGDAFAFGFVVIDLDGAERAHALAWCDPASVRQGDVNDREWVRVNVPRMAESLRLASAREMREAFWRVWNNLRQLGVWLAADCPWPVEAAFLHACIADDPGPRLWSGPYPLIDVASVRHAAGLDPLGTTDRRDDELPIHNPLADARQSARLLMEALRAPSAGGRQP